MKKTRGHGRLGAALRTLSLILTLVVLLTAVPVTNALGDDLLTDSAAAESVPLPEADELSEQTFELTPEDGVTVTLSGLMPNDGYAEAQIADVDDADVLHAYDITIYYRYGKEFQPDEGSPISVSFRSDKIADATLIQRYDAGMNIPFILNEAAADADGSGTIDVMDATALQYYLSFLHSPYDIGTVIN